MKQSVASLVCSWVPDPPAAAPRWIDRMVFRVGELGPRHPGELPPVLRVGVPCGLSGSLEELVSLERSSVPRLPPPPPPPTGTPCVPRGEVGPRHLGRPRSASVWVIAAASWCAKSDFDSRWCRRCVSRSRPSRRWRRVGWERMVYRVGPWGTSSRGTPNNEDTPQATSTGASQRWTRPAERL